MSFPTPGLYYIVNAVASTTTGNQLGVTFPAPGQPLTVAKSDARLSFQVWNISNYGDTNQRVISPANDINVQAVPQGDSIITTTVTGDYPWAIQGVDGKYTIQDKELAVYWDISEPLEGQKVIPNSQGDRETQQWWLYHAN